MNTTRDRLLDAGRKLLRGGVAEVSMAAVARVAEVSRQAVYLHFADRQELLAALVDRLDREADLETWIQALRDAPTAEAAVIEWAHMQAFRNPRIATLARELDARRHTDTDSGTAWRERSHNRMEGAREMIRRLAAEGRLHTKWNRDEAAVLLAELLSFRVWDDLVNDAKLAIDAYVRMVVTAALTTLAHPPLAVPTRRQR